MGLQGIFVYIAFSLLCASASASYVCPTLFAFLPDSNDCSRFYRCVWGKPVGFVCPVGTLWSQELLTCDHAARVPCGYNNNNNYDNFVQPQDYHNGLDQGYGNTIGPQGGQSDNVNHYSTPSYGDNTYRASDYGVNHRTTPADYYNNNNNNNVVGGDSDDADYNGYNSNNNYNNNKYNGDYTGHAVEPYPNNNNNYNNYDNTYKGYNSYPYKYQYNRPNSDLFRAGYGYKKIYHKK